MADAAPEIRLEVLAFERSSPRSATFQAVAALMAALAPQGRLVLLGVGRDPLPLSAGHLVRGERNVLGSMTGTAFESERTLDFSVLAGVRPRIETMPLEGAAEAVAGMRDRKSVV